MKETNSQITDSIVLRIWAAIVAVLVALTWKLWFPGATNYPRVPIAPLDPSILVITQYFASVVLIGGLAILAIVPHRTKVAVAMIAAGLGLSFLCNQHCLQPWAWQAFIIATLLFCLPMTDAKKWIAWLLISIYLYSAIGKFDYQFIATLGNEFLNALLGLAGVELDPESPIRRWLVLLFPIGELLIGIGLIFGKTRKLAAVLAIALHAVLIVILSPIGLGHRLPVMIWNGLSIVLVGWLFLISSPTAEPKRGSATFTASVGVVFALLVILGPLLRPLQFWDHWLAWGLYSPSNSRVELLIADSARSKVAPNLQQYLTESEKFGLSQFALDRWSLDELGVPIYPQARFQKVVAMRWLVENNLINFAQLYELSSSHPLTGQRSKEQVDLRHVARDK